MNSERRVRKDPYEEDRRGPVKWVSRLVILFLVTTACVSAAFLLYSRWLATAEGSEYLLAGSAPDLNPAERIYLQTFLAARADRLSQPLSSGQGSVPFVVEAGQNAGDIAEALEAAGLLSEKSLFLNYLRYHGLDSGLEAGSYEINPRWTIPELALALTQSSGQEIELRFLEGWRAEEMAAYLSTVAPARIDPRRFLEIVQRRRPFDVTSYAFLGGLPDAVPLQGYLFPDTYRIPVDADAAFLIDLMLRTFDRRVSPELRKAFVDNGLTLHQAVTLASIVERETPLASERPMVAAVFYNRLGQSMKLQADPTVQYAVGFHAPMQSWWKSPLTQADLEVDSPYNTYRYEGLPPTPIANPGLASMEAVAFPAQSDNLYFVADCNAAGAHLFSQTYAEHLVNVERCREQ